VNLALKGFVMLNAIRRFALCMVVCWGLCLAEACGDEGSKVKWEPVGLSGGGSMFRPSFSPVDPNVLMINSDMSCLFMSHDGGKTWEMMNAGQVRSSTSCYPGYHPTDAKTIFVAQGVHGMKVTHDQGKTWTQVESFPMKPLAQGRPQADYRDLCGQIGIDPGKPDRMLAGDEKETFISQDGAKTWTKCEGPQGLTISFHFDQTSPVDKRIIYAATADGIWKSLDCGNTWSQLPPAVIGGQKLRSFTGGSNAQTKSVMLYCSVDCAGADTGAMFRSGDGGKTWHSMINQSIADGSTAMQFPYVFTTDINPKIVVAFNIGTGFKPPFHNTAWRSDDAGDTWRYVLQADPRYETYNCSDMDYWTKCAGQFLTWEARGVGFDYANPDRLMRCQSSLLVTHDSKTWFYGSTRMAKDGDCKKGPQPTWLCTGLVVTGSWNYDVDPFSPNRRYIGYGDIGFAISDDADKTWAWAQQRSPNTWGNSTYQLAFDPEIPGKVWGAFSGTHDIPHGNVVQGFHKDTWPGGVGLSLDHCDTWTRSNTGLPELGVISVVLDPKSPKGMRTLYCSVWHSGVYKSVDDGKTWAKGSDGLGDPEHPDYTFPLKIVLHPDGTLFVLLTGRKVNNSYYIDKGPGLYRSADGAKTWQLVNKGAHNFWFWPKDYSVDPKDSKIIYVGAADAKEAKQAGLYRTTDGGATWSMICKGTDFGGYLHPKHPGWIYATCCEGDAPWGLNLSKDNGKTFAPIKGFPFGGARSVVPDPNNDQAIYVTTWGGGVWHGPAWE
jgi:photosystem II stability/assembly factor-like uncharacterized protein